MPTDPPEPRDDARAARRSKLIGRLIVIAMALLLAVYLAPLFVPVLRPH